VCTYYQKITRIVVAVLIAATMFGTHLAGTVSYISLVLADWEDVNTIPSYSKDRIAQTIPVFNPNGGKQDGKRHSLDQQSNFPNNKSIPPGHGDESNQDNDNSNESGGDDEDGGNGGGGGLGGGGMLSSAMLGALAGMLAGKNGQQGGGAASLDQLQQRAQNVQSQLDAMEEAQQREELSAVPTTIATPTLTPTSTATAVATGTVTATVTGTATAGGTATAAVVVPPSSATQTSGGK
jgi:hypothetical protein